MVKNTGLGEARASGASDQAARRVVAERLGHHRIGVTHSYVP